MGDLEMHNLLTTKFMMEIVGPMLRGNAPHEETMVLFESLILGMLETNSTMYGLKPQASVVFLEEAMQQAIIRYTGGHDEGV